MTHDLYLNFQIVFLGTRCARKKEKFRERAFRIFSRRFLISRIRSQYGGTDFYDDEMEDPVLEAKPPISDAMRKKLLKEVGASSQ